MPATHRFLAAILAALAAIGPFSIDTYLPAFHDIGAGLAAHAYDVQLTLTFYMGPFAFMVLWHGALADRFGRRNVILVAMAVFALAIVRSLPALRQSGYYDITRRTVR